MRLVFNVMRTSVGDVQAPDDSFWISHDENMSGEMQMIFLIYMYWIMNIFFIFIVLMNFLIAIVSASYSA